MAPTKGVALLLFSRSSGRLLVMRELESKPDYEKYAGMLSFPIETMEGGETPTQAVRRLLFEETGIIMPDLLAEEGRSTRLSVQYCETLPIALNEIIHSFYGRCENEFTAIPFASDVAYHGWMTIDELLSTDVHVRRREVEPVIRGYQKKVFNEDAR